MLRYSAHQASFLPWIGFWKKLALADFFDIVITDQFAKATWQHYTYIGDTRDKIKWGLPIDKEFRERGHKYKIKDVTVHPGFASTLLERFSERHYREPHFTSIFPLLCQWLESVDKFHKLWLINYNLIILLHEYLGLKSRLVITPPVEGDSISMEIIKNTRRYDCNEYLSGPHGKNYLDMELFKTHNTPITFINTDIYYENYRESIIVLIAKYGIRNVLDMLYNDKC